MTSLQSNQKTPIYHYTELEKVAKTKIDHKAYTYIQSGSGNEETLVDNELAFKRWKIRPQFLNDVAERDLSVSFLGTTFPTPYFLAPVGHLGIADSDGELAVARATKDFQVPFIASTVSTYTLEEIATELGATPKWFQLYWAKDRDFTASLVKRAEKAGYSAIVITIDTPMLGWREADLTNQYFPLRIGKGSANYFSDPVFRQRLKQAPEDNFDAAIEEVLKIVFNPSLSWEDLNFIKGLTDLPIILKGVIHPDDAIKAIQYKADGIIVSNHGGRQLDGCLASLDALPDVVEAVNGRIPILFDSGIRRGSDVIKAIALGADAVLLGRPYAYGLAVNGEEGVREVLDHFIRDLDTTLATTGKTSIQSLDSSILVKV